MPNILKNIKIIHWSVLLFAIYYLLTSLLDVLTPDDHHFLHNIHTEGSVWQATLFEYNNWSTRFISVLFNHGFLVFHDQFWMLPLKHFLSFTGLFLAFKQVVSFFNFIYSKNLTALVISILFYFSILDINSTWFWHCASFTYAWSLIAFIWGSALLFKNKPVWYHYLWISILFIYVGNSYAPAGIITVFCLLLFPLVPPLKKHISPLYFLALTGCIIGLTILLLGPGNENRSQLLTQHSIIESLWINTKSILKIYLFYFPKKIMAYALVALFASRNANLFSIHLNRKSILMILLATLCITFIYHFPIAYIMGDIGPPRTFNFISLFHFVAVFVVFASAPLKWKPSTKIFEYSFGLFVGFYLLYFTPIHFQYNKAVKERYQLLLEDNHQIGDTHLLIPLPNNGQYFNAEITSNHHHFLNHHLIKTYDLKCKLIIPKKKN